MRETVRGRLSYKLLSKKVINRIQYYLHKQNNNGESTLKKKPYTERRITQDSKEKRDYRTSAGTSASLLAAILFAFFLANTSTGSTK